MRARQEGTTKQGPAGPFALLCSLRQLFLPNLARGAVGSKQTEEVKLSLSRSALKQRRGSI